MAERIRVYDWSATLLGPPAGWPSSLKAVVRIALTTLHPIFIFWGPEHTCIYNDAYSHSLGAEKHPSILGAPGRHALAEIWHIIGSQIDMVMRGDGATWHENQLVPILRHGAIQDAYWTYSYGPIDDESAPAGIGGVLVLITETTSQVLAEKHFANERKHLAQLFDQAPIFMTFLQGPDHRIELANPGYLKIVGDRPVLGRTVAEALPDAVGQGYLQLLNKVYASGEAYAASGARYAFRPADSDAEVERFVDFVYQPIKDASGSITGIFVVGSDVTDRTLASQALECVQAGLLRSEEQLRMAIDAAEVGVWDVDLVTDTLFWPARVKSMFGISPDVPVTMADFYAGLHPDDVAATTAASAAAMDPAQRSVYDIEYRTIGKEDGVIRWIAAKGRAIFDANGQCTRVLGTAIDITRRKTTEASLKERDANLIVAIDALQQADRNKNTFLATLGHELRNPLATMRNAMILWERAPENAELISRVKGILARQVDHLVRLTDDLLDVGRISHGKIDLQCATITLGSVIAQAKESCAPAIELARQHLELRVPDSPAMIYGDSARLVQVFGNLIGNASKFTPHGGRIDVVTRLDGHLVVTSVKDTGIGMSADQLVRAFEPFQQFSRPGRSNTGLGIGLALAKQLVEMHGGSIDAHSTGLGEGSELVVRLPLYEGSGS